MKTIPQPATQPATLKVSDYALIHDIPEWAIYSLEYGEGKEDMRDEDLENIEEWEKDYFLVCPVDNQQVSIHAPVWVRHENI